MVLRLHFDTRKKEEVDTFQRSREKSRVYVEMVPKIDRCIVEGNEFFIEFLISFSVSKK